MDDREKWLEAAAGIEEDLAYLRASLRAGDIEQLQIALAVYRNNAACDVPWPNPDDLYCIQTLPYGAETMIATEMRRDFRQVC